MVCLLSVVLLNVVLASAQQGGNTTYVYDDDGRLHAVLSPIGEAAVYEYDAAGNFTAIRRLTPNDLELLSFTPHEGPVGTQVTIFGTGFNQGINSVSFNGSSAQIVRTSLVSVVAVVPQVATTGLISIVTPRGTISTADPFVVRGIRLSPEVITLPALDSVQFALTVSGTPNNNVTWSVNGVDGGNASVGNVTALGFYTAPNLVGGNPTQYIVRATSADDPELFGEGVVIVVPFGAGYQFRSDGLSVRYGTPSNTPPTFINGAISVRYGAPANNSLTYINGSVSVRYGTPANNSPSYINGAVSVRYGPPANSPPTFVTGAVSASRGPVLTSLRPGTISRGTSITLTIDGVALNGAPTINFFRLANGNPATGITVSNINVNAPGTTLTATITVASNVTTGSYVVVVTTASGSTVRNDVGTNIVQIN
jgi:YD repeat-containing protein